MASGILRTPRIINVQPTKKHTASLFIFHGSGNYLIKPILFFN